MKTKTTTKISILFILLGFFSLNAQTVGTLTFKLGDKTHSSTYSGTKRCLGVWIEQNTTGTTWVFVKSLAAYGKNTQTNHLPTWKAASASNTTGVSSTSTLSWSSGVLQTLTWNGQNVAGTVVTDGNYRVAVEETWDHGTTNTAVEYFPFTKGTASVSLTPTSTNFNSVTLTWQAPLATDSFTKSPEAIVYPNPSKGVFNIDFKSDVNNIKVVDILGKVIYNEDIKETTALTTKNIDMSRFNNGIYLVRVSNDNGTSTYKVLLEK